MLIPLKNTQNTKIIIWQQNRICPRPCNCSSTNQIRGRAPVLMWTVLSSYSSAESCFRACPPSGSHVWDSKMEPSISEIEVSWIFALSFLYFRMSLLVCLSSALSAWVSFAALSLSAVHTRAHKNRSNEHISCSTETEGHSSFPEVNNAFVSHCIRFLDNVWKDVLKLKSCIQLLWTIWEDLEAKQRSGCILYVIRDEETHGESAHVPEW